MEALQQAFAQVFGNGEGELFFAPGRVNLIGEHIDYNGGYVFPCALDVGTYAMARRREDGLLRLYSMNFKEQGVIQADLADLQYKEEQDWANYPIGMISTLLKSGYCMTNGVDILFYGDIPNGAGLSSSASIEVVTGAAMNALFNLSIDGKELAILAQRAENEFVGVNCGIMDQFAVAMGRKEHAILLDCDSLDYSYSPLQLADHSLIIANTNKRRGLADSKYNERRKECERALTDLQQNHTLHNLCEISPSDFEQWKDEIGNDVDRKRVRHVVYEHERTKEAARVLASGDLTAFGNLMNDSHRSLREDYEVTGHELDALVSAAQRAGAVGARMTGAGFGGCTVNLVRTNDIQSFMEVVGREYEEETGIRPDFYVVEIGDGVKSLAFHEA
ncbi:galactokinase [Pontibacillus halophilus JSM 076056 = DSM 19796]|uniref:Galactokinase n=1 Tax=Pontibacillus halophilus JSM 076056 = DSM 19796 TaxID=1385510 RepID=A0A0A5GRV8_9BACI|nr:galactokinase [Pontibacillus halophilus]KGX93973.1 galactokinase [Pontibacillus halophilus JSM 076056 = DSM 19796]